MYDEASRYRRSREREFAELDRQFARTASAESAGQEARQGLELLKRQRERLEAPVQLGLFNHLKDRLEQIPTQDQRGSAK